LVSTTPDVYRFLTGQRVDDQQRLLRLEAGLQRFDLLDDVLV
jgi:hypothetical protein